MQAIIGAGFAFLIGLVGLWTGVRQFRNRAALNNWPTTAGRVVERGTFQPNIATATQSAFRHAPLVRYAYQVGGQEFTSDQIRARRIQQPQHNTESWAQKKAASYPDDVVVHYNPEDPGESFLEKTPAPLLCIVIAASCFAVLFGVILLVTR
ncbi:MAG TPA: DUF3592 domain-containing protein [Pyrinomonadaceae bacterium]|nr:DUF3592 domain-containing protein [Pyrinomonadaceae bacterium]